LRLLEGAEVDGRPLKLDLDAGTDTPSKGRRPPLTSEAFSCFLGNLPFSCAEGDVSHLVTTAVGDVPHKVRLAYTAEGRSRGFGHVDFGSDETVEAAVAALDGMEVFDRQVSVCASVAFVRAPIAIPPFADVSLVSCLFCQLKEERALGRQKRTLVDAPADDLLLSASAAKAKVTALFLTSTRLFCGTALPFLHTGCVFCPMLRARILMLSCAC
jgi:hypothetical protein